MIFDRFGTLCQMVGGVSVFASHTPSKEDNRCNLVVVIVVVYFTAFMFGKMLLLDKKKA